MLITALEASPDVPALSVVTERLLHKESKMKNRALEHWQQDSREVDVISAINSDTTNETAKNLQRSKVGTRLLKSRPPKLEPSK